MGETTERLVVLSVAGTWLAIPAGRVDAFRESEAPTPVPGAPAHVPGVVGVAGEAVPVLDLARFLGLPPPDEETDPMLHRLAIVSAGRLVVALACDRVEGVVLASPSKMGDAEAIAGGALSPYTVAVVEAGSGLAAVLDVESLLEAARVGG